MKSITPRGKKIAALLSIFRFLEILLQHRYRLLSTGSVLGLGMVMIHWHARDHSMVPVRVENFAVTAFAVLEELSDACDGRGACAGIFRDIPVGNALCQLLGYLKPLTQGLKLGKSGNITKKIRYLFIRLTGYESAAQRPEPRFLSPTVFGETLLWHR
jgi:hypothetical protein